MAELRRWQLNLSKPFSLQLAADARLSRTDYSDDQVWEVQLGAVDSPALALQTQHGGRAGLVSLVPMWLHEGRSIYQYQAYAKPPVITAFAPGYLHIQAKILPTLTLEADYWAMESHAVGARFTLDNSGAAVPMRLELFGHVIVDNVEQKLAVVAVDNTYHALALGHIGNLLPIVVLDNGNATDVESVGLTPKIGATINVPAKGSVSLRWVHAGRKDERESLALAQAWLAQDWNAHLDVMQRAAQRIPQVETGKSEWDSLIASAYNLLVDSFLKPTGNLPYGSFVATRQPMQGFSARGDGSDYKRSWNGQEPTLAYLAALPFATIDPVMAQGVIRNYLALQGEDGWIDRKPGLGGQRQDMLCMPVLARLAWGIFQATDDTAFLTEVFPGLLKFFERWLQEDGDQDGVPEWQSERQMGYVFLPSFAIGQAWGQNADVRTLETPDLAAYLLSEALSLREMAQVVKDKPAAKALDKRIPGLQTALDELWHDGRYGYRDRDTHITAVGVSIIKDGRADEEHLPAEPLSPPNRLIVRILGGGNLTPKVILHLDGLDANGQPIQETADTKAFLWSYGRGVYTSQQVFSQIDRVRLDGMSRVYKIEVDTLDSTRLDINALVPLALGGISQERAETLVKLLTDKRHFWRTNGVAMTSAQDASFAPDGCGSVWLYWVTLIGEGLLQHGYAAQAFDLLKRILNMQTDLLKQNRHFWEFYHSDASKGLGERGHLGGIVPLHLLARVMGVQIVSSGKVWTGGVFVWDKPVTVTQHGVTVKRSKDGTQVAFPSGYKVQLKPGDAWQAVVDPTPTAPEPIAPLPFPEVAPNPPARATPKSVKIEVQHDSDT